MPCLAVPLLVAASAALPPVRQLWRVDPAPAVQPTEQRITAELVAEGEHVAIYREQGYHFSVLGPADEAEQIRNAVKVFDSEIWNETSLVGPCPDIDGNGKVLLVLTALEHSPALFWRFDEMSETDARRFGFHSNQGEVLYAAFAEQGNRSGRNLAATAAAFSQLLHYARDPSETSWSELVGNFTPFMVGLAPARSLWGELGLPGPGFAPFDPWNEAGWPVLFLEYLREHLGPDTVRALVAQPETGFAGLHALLEARGVKASEFDTYADFAMACWLDDPLVGDGRFAFSGVTPPRPRVVAHLVASRPTAGQTQTGVGGATYILVEANGGRSLPLTLRGETSTGWVGRAVKLRHHGPDEEIPFSFDASGVARLELAGLEARDAVVVAVVAKPADAACLDHRNVLLQWGLGWIPQPAVDRGREVIAKTLAKALPDGGAAARERIAATLDRLAGTQPADPDAPPIRTRYAWSPDAHEVVELILGEAERHGLRARTSTFVHTAPADLSQEWHNVVIELPGTDPRRWPIVLAAHWDGARARIDDSYLRAVNLEDNASGVAVALATAGALRQVQHRAPIVVALLAGGYQGAAGARALLDQMHGQIAAWVELDGVGVPDRGDKPLTVLIEGGGKFDRLAGSIASSLRRNGTQPKVVKQVTSTHCGQPIAEAANIPAVVLQTHPPQSEDLDAPPEVEQGRLSGDLMVLLTKGLAAALAQLAGIP